MSDPRCGCYIGNIDSSVSLELLKQCFQQCGRIVHASLNGKETDPYRFGFIDFATEEERDAALRFDGVDLAGRKLKVGRSKGSGKDGPTPGAGLRVPISIPQPAPMPLQMPQAGSAVGMPMPMMYEAAPYSYMPPPPPTEHYRSQYHGPPPTKHWSPNEAPSSEMLRYRSMQKDQFFEVIKKQADEYMEKNGTKVKQRSESPAQSVSAISDISAKSGKNES
jgi:RNA recognition motif-containing protein